MTAVQRLNDRLNALPEDEREAMAEAVLAEWEHLLWDRQIEADSAQGKLDHLIDEVKAEIAAGRTRPL